MRLKNIKPASPFSDVELSTTYSLQEVADLTGEKISRLRYLVKTGVLEHIRNGSGRGCRIRILKSELVDDEPTPVTDQDQALADDTTPEPVAEPAPKRKRSRKKSD